MNAKVNYLPDGKVELNSENGDYYVGELKDGKITGKGRMVYKKEAAKIILSKINTEQVDDTFDNARCARRLLDAAIERQALRLSDNIEDMGEHDLQILEASDFGKIQGEAEDLEGCLEELDSLVGLTDVKAEINSFVQAVKVQNESRKRGLSIASNPISLNMVFTGNAGTGKTSVARLLSKIYFHLGLLKRPDVFIECTCKIYQRYRQTQTKNNHSGYKLYKSTRITLPGASV